ncbi:MAG: VWA domain-containing protein [Nitrosopumilaceae archaeon]
MQSLHLRNDTLLEIATFLVRRWSEKQNISVGFSDRTDIQTKIKENKVVLFPLDHYFGTGFQKYRQLRVTLWYEAMRLKHCTKILSNDHAFGFLLNTLETRRIETIGRKHWKGMNDEIIFSYGFAWLYRPLLNSLFGKSRIVEGFSQYFLMGDIKGELTPSQFDKIVKAAEFAKEVVRESIEKNHATEWLEKKIPEIIKILEIDSLLTIPLSVPKISSGIAISDEDFVKTLGKIAKFRESDFGELDPKKISEGTNIFEEFKVLLEENQLNENRGLSAENIGMSVPSGINVDESKIYDAELVSNLKTKFKEWKTGWKEQHVISGDEFDEETYLDGHTPFFTDKKITIKTRIVILLDHSSSIANEQTQYKKATLALCEVLSFLKIKFSVYAFNTEQRQVTCWLVKSENVKWNRIAAKRLAQINANGGTPLAEVYSIMLPMLRSKKPDIFLTLSDGEPSDPDAVRSMVHTLKLLGIKMVAIGVGPSPTISTIIASNLKHLGYENTLAVSRLNDIPNRVLNVLGRN